MLKQSGKSPTVHIFFTSLIAAEFELGIPTSLECSFRIKHEERVDIGRLTAPSRVLWRLLS